VRHAAAAAALAAAWLLVAADVVLGGPFSDFDVWLTDRMHLAPRSPLALALLFWTNLHSYLAIALYSAVLVLLLARRRAWPWVAGLVFAVAGGMLVNWDLKLAVQRTRPVLDNPALALETYSFPSGHTAGAMLFYGMLAAYLASRFPRYRLLFLPGATLLIASVACSRIALGAQYFGDALAAALSSGAWLIASAAAVRWLSARR
jgi:membrane-associated phospholipid phosphatase